MASVANTPRTQEAPQPDAQLEALFRRMPEDGSARDELVRRFQPLARRLSRRYAHSSEPDEDLFQVAAMALLKAIDRFDPDRGSGFVAFAIPTILGELRRYFRDCAWSVHVPRAAQERALHVAEASKRLASLHGRSPSAAQLAEYLELDLEDVLDGLYAAQAYSSQSLDAPAASEGEPEHTIGETLGARETRYELVEADATITPAIRALPERDRWLLRMRFGEELTQSEIAARMCISQMQVSRLLRRTIQRLRELAGLEPSEDPEQ